MPSSLIFAWREDHVKYLVERNRPSDLVISLDLDVSALLRAHGIAFREIGDFLSYEELKAVQEDSLTVMKSWYKPFEAACTVDGMSPLQVEELAFSGFFHHTMVARLLFLKIVETHAIAELILFRDAPVPGVFLPIEKSIVVPVWRYMAEARGIDVSFAGTPPTQVSQPPRFLERIKQRGAVIQNLVKNRAAWRERFRRSARDKCKTFCIVVLIGEGFRFSGVINDLYAQFGSSMIPAVVGGRSSGGVIIPGQDWNYLSFSLIPDYRYFLLRRQAKNWYQAWLAYQRSYTGALPEIFANPHFDFQFRHFFLTWLPNSAQTYREARTILRKINCAVLLGSAIPHLYLTAVYAAAKSLAIDVVTFPHSGIPTEKHTRCRGDVTLVWTQDYVHAWQSVQVGTPIIVTGLHNSIIARGFLQERQWEKSQKQRKRILLVLATVQQGIPPLVDVHRHEASLRTILNVPPHLRDKVEVILKLHPHFDYRYFYESLIPAQSDCVQIVRESPLEEMVNESELVVMVNISTSAYLLAMSLGIPTIYIETAKGTITDYLALASWSGETTIHQDTDIWTAFEQVLFDDAARQQLVNDNRTYWDYLEAHTHDPIATIRGVIEPYLR